MSLSILSPNRLPFQHPLWACALLCLVAWRGPIPVVHAHQQGGPAADSFEHLDRYHADDEEVPSDWHFHLMMPEDVLPRCGDEARSDVELAVFPAPSSVALQVPQTNLPQRAPWDAAGWSVAHRRIAGGGENAPPHQTFLASILCVQPRCAALGVLRC